MAKEETTATPPATTSGGKKTLLLLLVCSLLSLGVGGAVPYFYLHGAGGGEHGKEDGHHGSSGKQAYVPFGDGVVVNLNEDRLTRYLKIKLLLVVDARDEEKVNELLQKKKPALRNWLIGHLSDKSLQDVTGAAGLNKVQREIWQQFNHELYPDGSEKVLDIYFEECVVQ
jgi:flagellar basal body-associated protein FliL